MIETAISLLTGAWGAAASFWLGITRRQRMILLAAAGAVVVVLASYGWIRASINSAVADARTEWALDATREAARINGDILDATERNRSLGVDDALAAARRGVHFLGVDAGAAADADQLPLAGADCF